MTPDPQNKSLVFVTTPTSGSASIHRILSAMKPNLIQSNNNFDEYEENGTLYLVRGSREFKGTLIDPRLKYIVNFRDPRDMLCNQFHWLTQHPAPNETARDNRLARHALGMDANVLRVKDEGAFRLVLSLANAPNALFVSYAQLCCDFQPMVDRIASFLDVAPSDDSKRLIELESPEKVTENPQWIGQAWEGCDIMPGRYKRDLKPETIAVLNQRWGATLATLSALEQPHLRHLYSTDDAAGQG